MPVPLLAISRTEINQITLLDVDEPERELATIPVTSSQPFGLAFDETHRWLYSACWTSGKIVAIDLSALKERKSFPASRLPGWAKGAQFVPLVAAQVAAALLLAWRFRPAGRSDLRVDQQQDGRGQHEDAEDPGAKLQGVDPDLRP